MKLSVNRHAKLHGGVFSHVLRRGQRIPCALQREEPQSATTAPVLHEDNMGHDGDAVTVAIK